MLSNMKYSIGLDVIDWVNPNDLDDQMTEEEDQEEEEEEKS